MTLQWCLIALRHQDDPPAASSLTSNCSWGGSQVEWHQWQQHSHKPLLVGWIGWNDNNQGGWRQHHHHCRPQLARQMGGERQHGEETIGVMMAQHLPPTTMSIHSQGRVGANSHVTTYRDGQ